MKKRRRKKRIEKTDIFEYAGLVLQFTPKVPLKTSYSLWGEFLTEHYPEKEHRFSLYKCCTSPKCSKIIIMFKVDPQPKGSGFTLQMSETQEPKEIQIGPNTIADLMFEKAFPEESNHKYYTQSPDLKSAKILSITEFTELCTLLTRHCYYTRMIFEYEQWRTMNIVMEGDPIYLQWIENIEKERQKYTDKEFQVRINEMTERMSILKARYTR